MLDALAPRHVGDVDQTVDLFLDLDERPELGKVADLALNPGSNRVLVGEVVPGIALHLLQAERYAPSGGVYAQDHGIHRVADVEDLRRVLDPLAPRHFGHMDQTFDARLELHERAVVGEAHHFTAHTRA